MLGGIAHNPIIVGAYADERGICPMLAAHREGGRTSFIGFAKAWDRFAYRGSRVRRVRRARRASERELLVLRTHLQASLLAEDTAGVGPSDLAAARAEHAALLALRAREAEPTRTGADRERPCTERRRPRAEHGRPRAEPDRPRARDDADRTTELRPREGWAWTRIVRRLDDYERVLERLAADRERADAEAGPPRADRELVGS